MYENCVSMLDELVMYAGDDGIIGYEVFLTIEVLRCFREVSFAQSTIKSHGRFLLRGSAGSPTSIDSALLVTLLLQNMYTCLLFFFSRVTSDTTQMSRALFASHTRVSSSSKPSISSGRWQMGQRVAICSGQQSQLSLVDSP